MPMTLGWRGQLGQRFRRGDRRFRGVVRMHARRCTRDSAWASASAGSVRRLRQRGADGDHLAHPGRGGARQHVRQFGLG